jgi:radical SAM superfamily enzyme YgiQ (UPF0313 family)
VANVMAEIRFIRTWLSVDYIQFLDDTFTLPRSWALEFAREYEREVSIPFTIIARPETVDAELLKALKRSGCQSIQFGVETANERIRHEVLRRNMDTETIKTTFRLCREIGILAVANYVLGFPGETPETIQETMALHRELQPYNTTIWLFYPYPGTDLEQTCRERGYLPQNFSELPVTHFKPLLKLPDISAEELQEHYRRFVFAWADELVERTRTICRQSGLPQREEELAQLHQSILDFYRMN